MKKSVKIKVGFSFFAFNSLIFLLCSSGEVLRFYTVCFSHELGHLIVLTIVGGRLSSVTLTAAGIRMETEKRPAEARWKSILTLMSGPAVNLAVFAFLSFFYNGGTAANLNLAAAIYNLLPYRQLDGGAAIALFTEGSVFQQTAELVLLAIRIVISVVLFIAFLIVGVKALPLFVVSLMLLVASYTGCNS